MLYFRIHICNAKNDQKPKVKNGMNKTFYSISQATRALTSWVVFLYLGALYRTPLAKKLWNWPIQEPVPVTFHEFYKFQMVAFRKFSGVIMKLVQSDLKLLGVQNQELPHPLLWIQVINFQKVSFFTIAYKNIFTSTYRQIFFRGSHS